MQITGFVLDPRFLLFEDPKCQLVALMDFKAMLINEGKMGPCRHFAVQNQCLNSTSKTAYCIVAPVLMQREIYGLLEIDIRTLTNETRRRIKRVWIWSNIVTMSSKYIYFKMNSGLLFNCMRMKFLPSLAITNTFQ